MRMKLMIICLTLLCGYAKAQTRGGDSSSPLPKEISAEMFDKAVELIKEFEGWHSEKHYPYYPKQNIIQSSSYNVIMSDLVKTSDDAHFHNADNFVDIMLQGDHKGNTDHRGAF